MGTTPVFASVSEATTDEQAETLRALERANSAVTAARISVLGAFTAGKAMPRMPTAPPGVRLMHQTGITRGAAVAYTAWGEAGRAASGDVRGDDRGGRALRVLRPGPCLRGRTSSRPPSGTKPTRS